MKRLLAWMTLSAVSFLFPFFASADQFAVDLTSFKYTAHDTTSAEICGRVVGTFTPGSVAITVIADPKGTPGPYNTFVGHENFFCIVVATYTGKAAAYAWVPGTRAKSNTVYAEAAQFTGAR